MSRVAAWMSVSALLLSGCNWGDSDPPSGTTQPPADTTAPAAAVTFPAQTAYTGAATTRIVGTASDAGTIQSVKVNGVNVTTTDNFAHWTIDVDLVDGNNVLTVSTTDAAGNVATNAAQVTVVRRAEIDNVSGAEATAAGDKLYFVDAGGKAIRVLTIADGSVANVADLARFGTAAVPLDLALDLANNRIFIGVRHDSGDGNSTVGVWAYDTVAKTWSAFSDANTPANGGPLLANPSDLVLDAQRNKLYVLDWVNGVFSIDLTSRVRSALSSNTVPNTVNALFAEPMDLALDSTGGKLYVVDRSTTAVFSVDVATGARTLVSRSNQQSGPNFGYPLSMTLDATATHLYVWDGASGAPDWRSILAVDVASGVRSVAQSRDVLPQNASYELDFYDVRSLVRVNDDLFTIDTSTDAITRVTFSPSQRTRVTNNMFPRNSDPRPSQDVTRANGKTYLLTPEQTLVELDATGAARTVAGAGVSGSAAVPGYRMHIDGTNNVAYTASYLSAFSSIEKVNLVSGAVTRVTDGSVASAGNTMSYVYDFTVDAVAGKVYAVTNDSLVVITIADGSRQVFASPASNAPAGISSPRAVAVDTRGNRVLIADATHPHLIAVDLTSGNFTTFSDSSASGTAFDAVNGVAVDSAGAIWVVDDYAKLVKVDRSSGARTEVSALDGSVGSGAMFPSPWYNVISSGDALFVIDGNASLIQVDGSSGARLAVTRGLAAST